MIVVDFETFIMGVHRGIFKNSEVSDNNLQ
jgi:hypothetical protein